MPKLPPKILFWSLLTYVVLQFAWWAYHMIQLSDLAYGPDGEFNRRLFMILGEGAVFLVILSVGSFVVYRSWRKELELAHRQENFLLSVTHELKSPLSSIRLALQSLSRKDLPEDRRAGLLVGALEENDRLQRLVDNILSSAENQKGMPELNLVELDLAEWLRERLSGIKTQGEGDVDLDITPPLPVLADRDALESVLRNLLDNAQKYGPSDQKIQVRGFREGDRVIILVRDHGPGISPANRKKVFEPFFREGDEHTRTHKGSGLGLYICDRLIRAHKGRIFVDPEWREGTQVRIELPLR